MGTSYHWRGRLQCDVRCAMVEPRPWWIPGTRPATAAPPRRLAPGQPSRGAWSGRDPAPTAAPLRESHAEHPGGGLHPGAARAVSRAPNAGLHQRPGPPTPAAGTTPHAPASGARHGEAPRPRRRGPPAWPGAGDRAGGRTVPWLGGSPGLARSSRDGGCLRVARVPRLRRRAAAAEVRVPRRGRETGPGVMAGGGGRAVPGLGGSRSWRFPVLRVLPVLEAPCLGPLVAVRGACLLVACGVPLSPLGAERRRLHGRRSAGSV